MLRRAGVAGLATLLTGCHLSQSIESLTPYTTDDSKIEHYLVPATATIDLDQNPIRTPMDSSTLDELLERAGLAPEQRIKMIDQTHVVYGDVASENTSDIYFSSNIVENRDEEDALLGREYRKSLDSVLDTNGQPKTELFIVHVPLSQVTKEYFQEVTGENYGVNTIPMDHLPSSGKTLALRDYNLIWKAGNSPNATPEDRSALAYSRSLGNSLRYIGKGSTLLAITHDGGKSKRYALSIGDEPSLGAYDDNDSVGYGHPQWFTSVDLKRFD